MRDESDIDLGLKDSCFDGFEYKGFNVKTKLVIDGRDEYKPMKLMKSSEVYHAFKDLDQSDKERFYTVLLDTKNTVIGVDLVSQGMVDSAPVHPREVYKPVLLSAATSVIFVHCHPSGDPEPSSSDWEITKQLEEAGKLLGIDVLDHVIIGRDRYYSFADKGMLNKGSPLEKLARPESKG